MSDFTPPPVPAELSARHAPAGNRYRIQNIYDAMQILKIISESKEPLATGEIAKALGLTMNTAFRMCETLKEPGFLQEIGGKYQIGMQMMLFWAKSKAKLESERDRIDKILAAFGEQ
jgi:DNA-binding IclR family transcriptional regulator